MKYRLVAEAFVPNPSPSVWRVWIEILRTAVEKSLTAMSPSVWRVWIEICCRTGVASVRQTSPSVWRVWIDPSGRLHRVTLRVEGVD